MIRHHYNHDSHMMAFITQFSNNYDDIFRQLSVAMIYATKTAHHAHVSLATRASNALTVSHSNVILFA